MLMQVYAILIVMPIEISIYMYVSDMWGCASNGLRIYQQTFWLKLGHGYITALGIFIELPQVKLSL